MAIQKYGIVDILVMVLAAYRLSMLIAREDGPVDIFFRLRVLLGAYNYGSDGRPSSVLGRLVVCPHCVGVWMAFACYLLYTVAPYVVWLLGVAGGVSWLVGYDDGTN